MLAFCFFRITFNGNLQGLQREVESWCARKHPSMIGQPRTANDYQFAMPLINFVVETADGMLTGVVEVDECLEGSRFTGFNGNSLGGSAWKKGKAEDSNLCRRNVLGDITNAAMLYQSHDRAVRQAYNGSCLIRKPEGLSASHFDY